MIKIGKNIEDQSLKDIINKNFDPPIAQKLIDAIKLYLTDEQEQEELEKRLFKALFKDPPEDLPLPDPPAMMMVFVYVGQTFRKKSG